MHTTPLRPSARSSPQYDHVLRLNLSLSRQILFYTSPHRLLTHRSYHLALRHTRQLHSSFATLNRLAAQPWHVSALGALSAALTAARARAAKKSNISPAQDVFALLSSFLGVAANCKEAAVGAEVWEVVWEGPVRQAGRRVADRVNKVIDGKPKVDRRESTEKVVRTKSVGPASLKFRSRTPRPELKDGDKVRAVSSLNEYVSRVSGGQGNMF